MGPKRLTTIGVNSLSLRFALLAHLSSKVNFTLYISLAGAKRGPEDLVALHD